MLLRELLPLAKDVARVVDVSPETAKLRPHLLVPDGMSYDTADPADLTGTVLTADTLLLCVVGPQEGSSADGLSPALRALPIGAKVLMLVGWTLEDLPDRLVLGPLVDGRCRVTDVVPVETAGSYSVHLALLAERVDELVPLHTDPDGERPASDPLAAQLTTANEHRLAEIVARLDAPAGPRARRPGRRAGGGEGHEPRGRQGLRAELAARDKELAQARRRVKALTSSPTFRLGRTLVEGAKHPHKAVVTVPAGLAKIWKDHRARVNAPAPTPRATHRTVSIPVPGSPQRKLTMTAPVHMLVPRQLAKAGLVGYETSSIPCFLAALDTAGPGAVLDIGANVGLYAALAAAVTDREVVAFEPFPTLSEIAEQVSAENDLGFRVESIALGRENGTATLYLSDSSDSSNSLAAGFRESTKQIEVPVETVDEYVRRTGTVPAVMKIDTETTEPDVLLGAAETLREHRPWVLCEVLYTRVEDRLTEALAPFGYHWYHITEEVPYQPATVIEGDRTYKHLMWLFAPEAPDEAFWAAVNARRAGIAEAEPDFGQVDSGAAKA